MKCWRRWILDVAGTAARSHRANQRKPWHFYICTLPAQACWKQRAWQKLNARTGRWMIAPGRTVDSLPRRHTRSRSRSLPQRGLFARRLDAVAIAPPLHERALSCRWNQPRKARFRLLPAANKAARTVSFGQAVKPHKPFSLTHCPRNIDDMGKPRVTDGDASIRLLQAGKCWRRRVRSLNAVGRIKRLCGPSSAQPDRRRARNWAVEAI